MERERRQDGGKNLRSEKFHKRNKNKETNKKNIKFVHEKIRMIERNDTKCKQRAIPEPKTQKEHRTVERNLRTTKFRTKKHSNQFQRKATK